MGSETPPRIARVAEIARPIAEVPTATDSVPAAAKKTTPGLHSAQCPAPVEVAELEVCEETSDAGGGPEAIGEFDDPAASGAPATE